MNSDSKNSPTRIPDPIGSYSIPPIILIASHSLNSTDADKTASLFLCFRRFSQLLSGVPPIATNTMNKLLLVALLVGYVSCNSLAGILRDQAPSTMKLCGSAGTANASHGFVWTDFQVSPTPMSDEKGLAGAECNVHNSYTNCGRIGADRTPVYAYHGASPGGSVLSPASFYNWFHDSPQTVSVPFSIELTSTTVNHREYSNSSFFPLDGRGWNDHCNDAQGKPHNFAFCFESHFRSTFNKGMSFTVTTSESVFVYVNDLLVIDLGGIHPTVTKKINYEDIIGLQEGKTYQTDFFFCERHTPDSVLALAIVVPSPPCSFYDWCGVCEGNGSTCPIPTSHPSCAYYDRCGVCEGNGSTCAIPTSRPSCAYYDRCGVCEGNGSTCRTPTSRPSCAFYDRCGVCEGNGSTCATPTSRPSCAYFDRCGVCEGNGSTCAIPTSRPSCAFYDRCGVCEGNGSTCPMPTSRPSCSYYDRCGVCEGNGSTCRTPTSRPSCAFYDRCGVCEGNGSTCAIPTSRPSCAYYDRCGVCEGNGSTCAIPTSRPSCAYYDRCGVCEGNGSTCAIPTSRPSCAYYDRCGVCEGNGSTCPTPTSHSSPSSAPSSNQ